MCFSLTVLDAMSSLYASIGCRQQRGSCNWPAKAELCRRSSVAEQQTSAASLGHLGLTFIHGEGYYPTANSPRTELTKNRTEQKCDRVSGEAMYSFKNKDHGSFCSNRIECSRGPATCRKHRLTWPVLCLLTCWLRDAIKGLMKACMVAICACRTPYAAIHLGSGATATALDTVLGDLQLLLEYEYAAATWPCFCDNQQKNCWPSDTLRSTMSCGA